MPLADDFVQGARAHPDRQWAARRILLLAVLCGGGEQIGLHAVQAYVTPRPRAWRAARSSDPHTGTGISGACQLVQKSHQRVRTSMPTTPMCSTGSTQVNSPK